MGSESPSAFGVLDVLVLLRRIMRAADLHSRRLVKATGLTVPQLLVLRAIQDLGEVTAGRVSAQVSLSQATVSTILDRLEGRGLIERYRSTADRRVVHTRLTAAGEEALVKSPPPLQERFITRFEALPKPDQIAMIESLRRVAEMMEAGEEGELRLYDVAETAEGFDL